MVVIQAFFHEHMAVIDGIDVPYVVPHRLAALAVDHLVMARRLARGRAIAGVGVADDHCVLGRPGRDVLLERGRRGVGHLLSVRGAPAGHGRQHRSMRLAPTAGHPATTAPLPRLTPLPQAATAFATFQEIGFVHFHDTLKGRRRARVGQEPMSPEKRRAVTDPTCRGRLMQRHPLAHARLISHPGRLETQPCQRRARQRREGLATGFRTAAKPHQTRALPMPHHPFATTVDACPRREYCRFPRLHRRGQLISLLRLECLDHLPLLRSGQRGGLGQPGLERFSLHSTQDQ